MDRGSVIVVIVLIVVAMVFAVRSGVAAALVAGWRIIALTLEAIVHVPLGILLIVVGVVIALALRDFLGCVIGGVCLYSGGNLLFGIIDGYVKSSRPSKPDR
jgi:hypothetical protein